MPSGRLHHRGAVRADDVDLRNLNRLPRVLVAETPAYKAIRQRS